MSQFAAEEFASLAMLPTSLAELDAATACMGFAAGGFSSGLDAGDMDNYDPGLALMGFSGDGFLCQHPDSPPAAAYMEALPAGFDLPVECPAPAPAAASEREEGRKQASNKRRVRAVASPDGASAGSPTPFSGSNVSAEEKPRKKDSTSRKVKKGRCSGKEEETPKEVVHVRARRGQATDSHSLAERVRREKINEKMRCLKDLVPGCYKAMGMAVVLDEIINYVQSLQNQVEFLSMKLSAASAVYDLNQELDSSVVVMPQSTLPRVGEADEAHEVDRLMGKGQGLGGVPASTQQCPFDPTFGHYSSLLS